ncbi:TPA: hypothetical protein JD169_08005, partial [Cronobacter malonaticus]|nr:hypothetical protein [Cronobacter malonaticus]
MAAPENKKGVRQCPKTLQDAFILSGLPAAVGELPGNGCQDLLSKGCARFRVGTVAGALRLPALQRRYGQIRWFCSGQKKSPQR